MERGRKGKREGRRQEGMEEGEGKEGKKRGEGRERGRKGEKEGGWCLAWLSISPQLLILPAGSQTDPKLFQIFLCNKRTKGLSVLVQE